MPASEHAWWIITQLVSIDRWDQAMKEALAGLESDEEITCAGTTDWIRGSAPEPGKGAYYFVTERGLHFGCGVPKKGAFSKPKNWDEFVPRSEIGYARTDHQHGLQLHQHNGESLALMWFTDIFDQYLRQDESPPSSAHHWMAVSAFEEAANVASALGIQSFRE